MKPTPNYQFSYPESFDHTRTWEWWQTLATQVDTLLAGKGVPLKITNDVTIGDPAATTDNLLHITKVSAGVALESRHRVFPTASGGGQGTVVSNEVWENNAEVAQLNYRRDGMLFLKSGGAGGVSRPLPYCIAGGFVNVPVGGVTQGTADWLFSTLLPPSRFSIQPLVFCCSTNSAWMVGLGGGDVTKAIIYAKSYNNTPGTAGLQIGVHLLALQMFPTANAG